MFLIIMFMVIIKRIQDERKFSKFGDWVYICGRRKTGKTFFVKNFTKWDEYFFVRKDRTVFDKEGNHLGYETFFELFKRDLGKKRIIIDEFHRLPPAFFDYLHYSGKKGKLIVVSSTLWLSKKLLGKGSPLLGLFPLMIFGLIDERDVIKALKSHVREKELIEASVYLREPILAPPYRKPIRKYLAEYLENNKLAIKELIGEIFSEEERKLSQVYEGILRAVASNKTVSTEISSFLYSKRLIPKDNPGLIQNYLNVLVKIGLLRKLEVYKKKKFRYEHVSPLLDLHFYLDEKYNYIEGEISNKFIEKVVKEKIGFHVEKFFREFLSKLLGMKCAVLEEPEVDIALIEFKKIKILGEVKWKDSLTKKEIEKIREKLNFFDGKKIIIVPNKRTIKIEGINVMDVSDFVKLASIKNPKI